MAGEFALYSLIASYWVNIPVRIIQYRTSRLQTHQTLGRTLYFIVSRLANRLLPTHILSNSQCALKYFVPKYQQLKGIHCEVIRNGIDCTKMNFPFDKNQLKKKLGISDGLKIIGHAGRGEWVKNYPCIIAVAEKVFEKRNDIYFLLCGKSAADIVNPLIQNKVWKDRIIMPGVRSDMFDVLRLLDLFIFPSWFEGQPNALLEAMCAGIPFVASNHESITEHIPEKYHHLLFDPTDSDAFAKEIFKQLDSPWTESAKKEMMYKMRDYCDPKVNFNRFIEIIVNSIGNR
jgi:glycosyltransferase involved in cell wall biosynthesis